jgi:predicted CxxxxCH...CXXCH cytochrome family protein
MLMSTATYAAAPNHSFACDNCHGRFPSGGGFVSAAKSCTGCHSPNGEASGKPVNSMANYFGSVPGEPATGSRSTHTYMVSYSSAPAGVINLKTSKSMTRPATTAALIATDGAAGRHNLNTTTVSQIGQVTCNRCHNAYGYTYVGPMLRATNDADALCYDCHLPRKTDVKGTGTHPVEITYSAYTSNRVAFRNIPLGGNSNNPTSNPGNYLSNGQSGKIVCTTCHAVHYADSSSATFDNKSSANGFNQDDPAKGLKGALQNSKGTLLRNDYIGSTAEAINTCSSCHKETANLNHDGKGQNVQCSHCHAAHVDYTGDASAKNSSLVRRDFSNISTNGIKLGANVTVLYNTTPSAFMRADNKGICQICHTPTPGVGIHSSENTTSEDCMVCHTHAKGFSASDCTSCHGQPPVTSLVGGPNGKASASYALDEAKSPHATHSDYYSYKCNNCHYNGTPKESHNTATASFQSVFVDTANSVGASVGKTNNTGDYNPSLKTCSNVYCHSNGDPRGTGAYSAVVTPPWEFGRNKILGTPGECSSCHASGSGLITNAHEKHVTTTAIPCYVCHASTVSASNAITDRTKHANGVKDISFVTRPANYIGVFSSSWNSGDMTCSNSCHSDGLGGSPIVNPPVWSTPFEESTYCGSCHAAVPDTSLHSIHFSQSSESTGPKLGTDSSVCDSCHVFEAGSIAHANGQIDLKPGNSCAPCHPGSSPIWVTGATVTCESCHTGANASIVTNPFGTYTAPLKSLNSTVGHGQYAMASQCTNCHSASAAHIGAGLTEKRLAPLSGNALCNNCHKPSVMGNMSTTRANLPVHGGSVNSFAHYNTPADIDRINAVRASECSGCHDTHGTTNKLGIRTVINGVNIAAYTGGSPVYVVASAPYNGLCQVCHTKTKYYKNGVASVAHNLTSDCLSCHKHKGEGVTYAFLPVNGDCGSCHGYPPVKIDFGTATLANYSHAMFEDYSGGGGAHAVAGHIPKTAVQSEAWINCTNCHNDLSHNTGPSKPDKGFVNVVVDPKFKFNNTSTIKYTNSTCSNVSCHFKPSPNWTNGL